MILDWSPQAGGAVRFPSVCFGGRESAPARTAAPALLVQDREGGAVRVAEADQPAGNPEVGSGVDEDDRRARDEAEAGGLLRPADARAGPPGAGAAVGL